MTASAAPLAGTSCEPVNVCTTAPLASSSVTSTDAVFASAFALSSLTVVVRSADAAVTLVVFRYAPDEPKSIGEIASRSVESR